MEIPAKRILVKCRPESIAEVHAIVEACDNIAVVRTLDAELAVVELIATRDTFADAMDLAGSLERLLGCEIIHPRVIRR